MNRNTGRLWFLLLFPLIFSLPAWSARAQEAAGVRVPTSLYAPGGPDRAMPALARAVLAVHRDDDPARDLGMRFRLQLVAGQPAGALDSIEALRALRHDPPSQPPLYLQYEVLARAQDARDRRGLPFALAWREAFDARFGALPDKVALQAEFGFGGNLARMRGDLDAALAKAAGRDRLPLADAIELLRAWQVHAAYAAFLPLFDTALAADDARRYAIDDDVLVRTPDGAQIATLVVRPRHAPALPALLTFTIYANDGWARADAKKMAAHGYAGVVAYTRGKGHSPDAIVPYEHDGADAAAVIGWIAAQRWNDGRVGMFGGSYSGFTQWAALKHRPTALKAIATSATTAPGIDVPMEGGVFLNFMVPWPFYVASSRALDDARYGDTARWSALDRDWYAGGRAYRDLPAIDGSANPVFAEWLRHPLYDDYWQAMIPQGDAFAAIDIPVLATTGYFDGAQVGVLHYFREHLRHRPDADHTLVVGPFEHFSMQAGVPPEVQGYRVDPAARIDLQALRLDWFDHVFKGAPKPALLAGRVNWQAMGTDAWRHADTLEAMATRRQRLYLVPGAQVDARVLSAQPQPHASVLQRIDFRDRSDADWNPPANVVNATLDPHLGLAYVGPPLQEDTELAGAFSGVLEFTLNKRDVDLAIGIYELNAAGEYLDLAWWLQRAGHAEDRRKRRLLAPGVPQRLVVRGTRLLGRKLAAGSRIVVTLGAIRQPDRQLNLGSGKPPAEETIADAGAPLEIRFLGSSYLELPIRE